MPPGSCPKAGPGPHDAAYPFDAFVEMMKTKAGRRLAELQAMPDKGEKAGA